jgi:DNA-directed RNA polymerase specialized sigma24 family protein
VNIGVLVTLIRVVVGVRNASRQALALTRARERRRELDRQRDQADQRIEQAAAEALVALDLRVGAQHALDAATAELAEAIRTLMHEDVSVERAAALLDLDVSDVRRLLRMRPAGAGTTAQFVATNEDPACSDS